MLRPLPFIAMREKQRHAIHPVPFLFAGSNELIDLSTSASTTFGNNATVFAGGKYCLWTGDVTHDGTIKYTGAGNDRDRILAAIGGVVPTSTVNGYLMEDVNLDGVVKYTGAANDRDLILLNIGGVVPTITRMAQLP